MPKSENSSLKRNSQKASLDYGSIEMEKNKVDKHTFGSPSLEAPEEIRTPKPKRLIQWYIQMILINFVEFSAESSRGIVLPTLFLYNIALGGDLAWMGILTSVFSIGRLISSMLFGWMCDRYSYRAVYLISSAICLLGNLLYLISDPHMGNSKLLLAFSRFIVGFGAGNRSVCRANVAALTHVNQRLRYLTILATVVFLGYALTPGLGGMVANIETKVLGLHINKYTAPGGILIIWNVTTIFLMIFVFNEEISRDDAPEDGSEAVSILNDPTNLPERVVKIGVIVFIFLNFNARGILSIFETINIPLFMDITGNDASSAKAVIEASNFQFYLGLWGLLSYFAIERFRHRVSDLHWLVGGFTALAIGNVILLPHPDSMSYNRLTAGVFFVWSIGCPITTAVVVAAFSKILGGKPQGTLMGLLGSAASISRIVLPLLPSIISGYSGLFLINVILCLTSIISLQWYTNLVNSIKKELHFEELEVKGAISPRSPIHSEPI